MSKIAIDVVLLPPEHIIDKAIEINSQFADDPIVLNKENCLPHISLCMGAAEESDLPQIAEILAEVSQSFSEIPLRIHEFNAKHTSFSIQHNDALQELHEKIMNALDPFISHDATTEMCFSPPPVVDKTLTWINNYLDTSFENFYPHITLGISTVEQQNVDIEFTASTLALCYLGNYCTCRKVLAKSELSKS